LFTGIIQELGVVTNITQKNEGKFIEIEVSYDFIKNVKIGDSIAIDGVCQTVTKIYNNSFTVFTSKQTLEITTLSLLRIKDIVNLEKALKLGEGLDGHIVYGHVECMGKIEGLIKQGEGYLLKINIDDSVKHYIIKKGSIAVDGISLTVYDINDTIITISIIPETYNRTKLKNKKIGDFVNIETDIIGKYIFNFLKNGIFKYEEKSRIDLSFLEKNGFL